MGMGNTGGLGRPGGTTPPVWPNHNLYRCGHCNYEGPCYGNGFSAPWCKQCQKNDKLTPIAGMPQRVAGAEQQSNGGGDA